MFGCITVGARRDEGGEEAVDVEVISCVAGYLVEERCSVLGRDRIVHVSNGDGMNVGLLTLWESIMIPRVSRH